MNVIKLLQNTRCYSCKLNTIRRNNYLNVALYSTASEDEIVIPKRIPRSSTDILKELAKVTKRDPTAPHYKYHDDPYLIPFSNHQKRIYALAQESGRKAAKWIRDENPALFQHGESEPPIEAYFPRARYDETDELDNETLSKIIYSALLSDAVTVYNIMKKRGDEISDENKQALLELVSFFNETEEPDPEFIEEKWFSQTNKENISVKKTWKDAGLAQQLFDELPESGKTYSAIIQGMAKYHQVENAFQYFKLAEEKGIVLAPEAYNSLIRVSFYMADGEEQRWEIVENLLKTMSEHGLQPNLSTLNSVLYCLSRVRASKDTKRYALKMIAEVKQFDVVPSLATYYHLLNIFYNDKYSKSYILEDILEDLESRDVSIQDPMDINFFYLAMEKCRYYLRDKDLAHRLNKILWHNNNYNLIGNSYKEASFYRNYFFLLVQTELMEDIMKIYDFLVPHIYTPEISVMEELIKCATMNGAVDLYKRLWTDTVTFEMFDKIKILSVLLEGMTLNQPPPTTPPSQITIDFADIAWSIYQKTESKQLQKSIVLEWTGEMLGQLIALLLHANEYHKAIQIFKKLNKDQNYIVGIPEPAVFSLFVDVCVKNDDVKQAMECVVYCANNGYGEAKNIAKKVLKNFSLSPAYQTQLTVLVGSDIFKDDEEEVQKDVA